MLHMNCFWRVGAQRGILTRTVNKQRAYVQKIETRIKVQVKRLAEVQKGKGCSIEDNAETSTFRTSASP